MKKLAEIRFERQGDDLVGVFPPDVRSRLGSEFVISIGTAESLVIHNPQRWQEILDRIDRLPFRRQRMLHPLLSHSAKIRVRADGSWTLPHGLADIARIEREAWLCIPEPSDGSVLMQMSLILTAHCP